MLALALPVGLAASSLRALRRRIRSRRHSAANHGAAAQHRPGVRLDPRVEVRLQADAGAAHHRLHRAALASDDYLFCNNFGPMKATLSAEDTTTADSVKAKWPKDTLVAKLKASFKFCEDAFAQLDDAKLAEQITLTFGGQSRQSRAPDGARPRARHGGSLQPDRELHAPERHHAAVGAASAWTRRELAVACARDRSVVSRSPVSRLVTRRQPARARRASCLGERRAS